MKLGKENDHNLKTLLKQTNIIRLMCKTSLHNIPVTKLITPGVIPFDVTSDVAKAALYARTET